MLDCGRNTHRSVTDKGLVSRRLLRVLWTARSNQSILKEINSEYSLEGLMLKLKLQYFGHLMWRDDSLGKDPDAGKDWGQEEKRATEDEMAGWHHQLNGHVFEQTSGEKPGVLQSMGSQRVRLDLVTEQQQSRIYKEFLNIQWWENNSI